MSRSLAYRLVLVSMALVAISAPGCQSSPDQFVPNEIVVKFKDGTSSQAQAQLNEAMGTVVVYSSPFGEFDVLAIPEGKTVEEMVEAYSKQPIVEYAEPNYIEEIPQPNGGEEMLHEAE